MTKVSLNVRGKGAIKNKPVKVPPAQHQHTANIKFVGVGEGEDAARFLKVAVGEKTTLLDVDKIADPGSGELKALTRLGEPLIKAAARREFLDRAHDAARAEPIFLVTQKTGYYGGEFVLPEGLDPEGPANVERYFDRRYAQYHRRLHPAGTVRGWRQLAELCRGKSRLMAGLCLSVSGPVCATFGYEAPGLQPVSSGGLMKTLLGIIVGTPWGGDETLSGKLGCGVSWNQTNLNLEIVAAAFNQMLLFLDEMHRADKKDVEKIIEIMNGEGRGRWTETQRVSFLVPMFSTSNTSVVSFALEFGMMRQLEALVDRLSDIPLPNGCPYMVEGIRTPDELRKFVREARDLSRKNFGRAGPEFARRLGRAVAADRAFQQSFADARQRTYWDAAREIKSVLGRDLTRVTDKFATAYIAGCLAARHKIFPYTEDEMLAALLTCERDHVGFVDQELGHSSKRTAFAANARLPATQIALAGSVAPGASTVDRLRRFVDRSTRSGSFIDLSSSKLTKAVFKHELSLRRSKDQRVRGYVARGEYWIPDDEFEEACGGSREAGEAKRELFRQRRLETYRRGGDGVSYVVKRPLPDGRRPYFVVIRFKGEDGAGSGP